MQYGGNQQRLFNMMMQARQGMQPPLYSSYGVVPRAAAAAAASEPTFVTRITENDVLLGRGTPCAENEGNVRFRRLVKSRKVEYIAAEKRMRKDAIAREILEVIASRGGKFLRKVESQAELEKLGVPPGYEAKEVWAIVDEDTQVQKVKQALRNKDDAAELMANAKEDDEGATASSPQSQKYGEHDLTNRFPRGVRDESDIHRADCKLELGNGALERVSSNSSGEGKVSSPITKKGLDKGKKSPSSLKSPKLAMGGHPQADLMPPSLHHLTSPANQRLLAGRLPAVDPMGPMGGLGPHGQGDVMANMMRRNMGSAVDGDFRTLQELQRLRLMRRDQMGAGPMMNPALGFGLEGSGAFGLSEQQLMMNAEYRQMQAQQAHMQQMAAAREQAAMFQRSSFTGGRQGASAVPSSAALAARQVQMEQEARRSSLLAKDKSSAYAAALDGPTPAGRKSADSAGERAIGIAQAMKRADAFSSGEALEVSYMESLILSVLCSHGLPIWTPEANTKSFVSLPTFAKRLDWTWYGFASVLKQKAGNSHLNTKKTAVLGRVEELALESAAEYQKDPRELATKTIMLLERLRQHCDASASASQRKQRGLGIRVPLWLDRELCRWAMTLDISDPTGRPVSFSSSDFVSEHAEYKEDPSVVATAAFDPLLADDVLEQVALLTRLRSVFVKTRARELHSKLEAAAKKAEAWDDQPRGWDVEPYGTRDLLLCDRLLSEGFSGVLESTDALGPEYQMGGSPMRFPSYESTGLTKSSIQQRASQIARELHVLEEQKELQQLQLDRMEKFAQSVLLSQPAAGEGSTRSLASQKKRKGKDTSSRSSSPADSERGSKKQKTTSK